MRRCAGLWLLSLVVAACGGEAASTTVTSDPTPTTTDPPSTTATTLPPRDAATVEGMDGTGIEMDRAPLQEGDPLTIGPDGFAVVRFDDGTTLVVTGSSSITLAALTRSEDGAPLTVIGLESGTAAAVRDDPIDGTFEIRAAGFAAGLSGSAVAATHGTDGGSDVSCLFGDCYLTVDGDTTAMGGNEWIDLSGGEVSSREGFSAEQRRLWAAVLAGLRETAGGFDSCACDERSLLCSGTIEIPYFPACPDDTTCECRGPDLHCEDGRAFTDDQQCMADMTPLAELLVPDFYASYECVEAATRYKVFDSRPEAPVVFRPYEDEATGCETLPFYPATFSIPGPDAQGELAGSGSYGENDDFDFVVVDAPGEGMQGALGPRYGDSFTVYGRSSSGGRGGTTISGEETDAVMARAGTETITVMGRPVAASVYEGSFTGWETWTSANGIRAGVEYSGTIRIWLHVDTGLELRREVESFYTGCSNCSGFVGLRERLEVTALTDTNQPLG